MLSTTEENTADRFGTKQDHSLGPKCLPKQNLHPHLQWEQQDSILLKIFAFFDVSDVCESQRVDKRWLRLCKKAIDVGFQPKKAFQNGDELREIAENYWQYKKVIINGIGKKYGFPIGKWEVGKVKDFSRVFQCAYHFNEDISKWDVSNAISMKEMFHNATSFNQSLERWDTRNVKNMMGMFRGAESFNQPVELWNTSNVLHMKFMFWEAFSFNQSLMRWDMRKVAKPKGMLYRTPFTHYLPNELDPEVVYDGDSVRPEQAAKSAHVRFGLSFVAGAHPNERKPQCLACKLDIEYDEPRIRNRHIAEGRHQPQNDQFHCRVDCIQEALSEEHFQQFMDKRWKEAYVQKIVNELQELDFDYMICDIIQERAP
jgi:surface protein